MVHVKKRLIKLVIFFLLVNLPFVTIIQIIGIDPFLDSFKNPDVYDFFLTNIYSAYTDNEQGKYLLIQKSAHPNFSVENNDTILYCNDGGKTACDKVYQINCVGSVKTYAVTDETSIYETQIYGKVLGFVDNNPWNMLSIKIWDISTHLINF